MLSYYWACVADSDTELNQQRVKSMCLLSTLEVRKNASAHVRKWSSTYAMRKYAIVRKCTSACASTQVCKYASTQLRKCTNTYASEQERVIAQMHAQVRKCVSTQVRECASTCASSQVCKRAQVHKCATTSLSACISAEVRKYERAQVFGQ